MNKGLANTQDNGVIFQDKSLPLSIGNFINDNFDHTDKPKVIEVFQTKKLISNQFLNGLPDSDFVRLLPYLESVSLSAGENIYQVEDNIDYVYFPENSVFSYLNISENGRINEIVMIGREGVVGFPAIFNPNPQELWTKISVEGSALKIKTNILKQEFANNLSIQNSFLKFTNSFITQISQRVVCNNYHLLEERLCTWLLMLYDRCGRYKLFLTHERIAEYMGVNRPSITHITQTLRRENIIYSRRGKIIISDPEKLKTRTCECYKAVGINNLDHFVF